MLHLLYGPAASGKTDLLMGRIRTAVAARTPGDTMQAVWECVMRAVWM